MIEWFLALPSFWEIYFVKLNDFLWKLTRFYTKEYWTDPPIMKEHGHSQKKESRQNVTYLNTFVSNHISITFFQRNG